MKYFILLCLTCYSFSGKSQDYFDLKQDLYSKLNSHVGWGLNAYRANGKTDVFFNSYAVFTYTPNNKLVYSETKVIIYAGENVHSNEETHTTTIRLMDITSFEYNDVEHNEFNSSGYNEEIIRSPTLIIHYTENGKEARLKLGFQLKEDKNVVQELNRIIKEMQKKMK